MPKLLSAVLWALTAIFFPLPALAVDLIWTDTVTNQILRGSTNSPGSVQVLFDIADYPGSPANVTPFGLAADAEYVYWSDVATGQILRGAIDGTGPVVALFNSGDYPGSPLQIGPAGLDVDNEFVYWADTVTGQILRGTKNGSGVASALFDMADYPGSPADTYPWDVTVVGESIYWTDSDTDEVLRGSFDGSGTVESLFALEPDRVNLGLALDGGFVYWTNVENVDLTSILLRGNSDGVGEPMVLYDLADYPGTPTSNLPLGLAVANGLLYWTDNYNDQVLVAPADGSGTVSVLFDIASYPGSPTQIAPSFLVVLESAYDADYDHDGDVDGRDFLKWQRGQSPDPLSSADLVLWQGQYGSPDPLASPVTVPEPSGYLCLAFSIALCSSALRPSMCYRA